VASYYYAAASLPYLKFDGDKYPDLDEFLQVISDWGDDADLDIIRASSLSPQGDSDDSSDEQAQRIVHPVVARFYEWETGLRNELVRQRAAERNRDGQPFIHRDSSGDDFTARTGLAEAVRSAIQASTPLEADELLDRMRWQFLDELEIGQFYNLDQMIVYYLRLQILLRRRSLTEDSGQQAFSGHYEAVHHQMQEIQNVNGEQA
jgi:hypothetical protein